MSQRTRRRFATCPVCKKAVSTRPQFHELTRRGEMVHPNCYIRLPKEEK